MAFNPLQEPGIPLDRQLRTWSELNVQPVDKRSSPAYTRCRIITMNGAEMEAMWFSHNFARHAPDLELKRHLAETRRIETQQQKVVNWLLPGDASPLETTISYEQVAVDLTAWIARSEPDPYAKACYEFGLLEDFDHLYRYANLMDMLEGKKAQDIVQDLTEITPGRPTHLEHRHPFDEIRKPLALRQGDPRSALHALTIVAAEQQTLNFYCNIGNLPTEPLARGLYQEIGQIEEQHVTHYESLLDAGATWAEMLVLHEYNECYLYYSFLQQEEDPRIKQVWETHLGMELEHLRLACELMKTIDRKDPAEILPRELPEPVSFQSNKDYIRTVLASQTHLTADGTDFVTMDRMPQDHRWNWYRGQVNGANGSVPSEMVINRHRQSQGDEYRLETNGEHPVDWLRWKHAAE